MSERAQQSPFIRALGASLRQRAAKAEVTPFARALASSLRHRAAAEAGLRPSQQSEADAVGGPGLREQIVRSLHKGWTGLVVKMDARRKAQRDKRLRVIETVALGEKRFVAIVAVQQAQFLVGHGPGGVSLLARLEGESALKGALTHREAGPSLAARQDIREAW